MQVIQIESYTPPPLTHSKAKSLTQSMPLTYNDWQAINNAQLQPIDHSNKLSKYSYTTSTVNQHISTILNHPLILLTTMH